MIQATNRGVFTERSIFIARSFLH